MGYHGYFRQRLDELHAEGGYRVFADALVDALADVCAGVAMHRPPDDLEEQPVEEPSMRIGLFVPCYIDAFFPEAGIATLELLERFGHEVVYPRDQTCCGQPMVNSGFNTECAATEALFV